MIEISELSKKYANQPVLDNVDLFIQEGEIFGIIGKSGAGKSTLLRCINSLETPDSGNVTIDNLDLKKLAAKDIRRARHKMSMIFQHFNLINNKTVYENIALPMRIQGFSEKIIQHKIEELLVLVELNDKANFYPAQLSGGQKQRVAIARALSSSPKILLCDEATSALDPETTESILALLKKINQLYGITIIIITHEMEVIKRICHRLAVMEKGQIIETTGSTNIIEQKNSVAKAMLYANLSPPLPHCLHGHISNKANNKPLLRIFFDGAGATVPFISHASRELNLDINILLANIDRFDGVTCGVLVVELNANAELLNKFTKRCEEYNLSVEILGYVTDNVL